MKPISIARRPDVIESRPSDGPTVRSSTTVMGAGSLPARRRIIVSRASSSEKLPVIDVGVPAGILLLMTGAFCTTPSSTSARYLPM